jgi:predicted ATPase/DNA-binding SARP family transcriptional activator
MDSQRYLRCLGQPALFAATGEPIRFRTRKHLALLVYIALENRTHRRDRLAELLWPNVSVTEARHSLATALSVLRPRVGIEALETTRDQVRLLAGHLRLDLDRLEAGDVLGSEVTGPLEVAAFLDGFDINDSAEFTHWKDRQQARLLPVIKDALLVLIDRCRRMGDTRQIERLADRMLALDELSEEAIRAKMEARAFAGDRLTALEIFEAWKKKLAEELQAAPSDLVEGMAVRLRRRGWERTTLANIPNVPTDQWRGRPFIGRSAEYRVLYELWEGVRKGVPGHALILGDSGVGKTTLVQRLTTAAGLEGAAITRVQCYDVEREIPYSTLSGLIIGLLDRPGVSATSPEALAELSRAVPQVRQRFPDLPRASDSHGETARIRLMEAFLEMLTAIAEEHPVILVVDDLHLADDVSVAVVHLIMRRTQAKPIMIVLVARPGELAESPQSVRLRESAGSLAIQEIHLPPLNTDETREMLSSLILPDEAQPGRVEQRALVHAAGGFPMVLELLVQDWKVSKQQCLALAVEAMTAELGVRQPAGSAYGKILDRITRSLDSTTYNVLNLAAMLGRRLNDLAIYAIVDLSAGQTMTGMAELVRRRVLRDGAQGLEFVNELVRAAAYIGVPPTLRHVLHGKIADRLIEQCWGGADELGLEVAWHCMRAGRPQEATSHLFSGARHAMRGGALSEGERALTSALSQSHLSGLERSQAVVLLADILQDQGRWSDLVELLAVEQRAGVPLSAEWVTIFTSAAKFHMYGMSRQEADETLSLLNELTEKAQENAVRVAAASTAAIIIGALRDEGSAKKTLEATAAILVNHLSSQDLTRLSLAKSRLAFHLRDREGALREIETTLSSLNSAHEISATAAQFQAGLASVNCMDGEYVEAIAHLRRAYDIIVRIGNDTLRARITANLALACGRVGDYERQLHYAEESLSARPANSADHHEMLASYCGSFACSFMGMHSKAREILDSATSRLHQALPPWGAQVWCLYAADLNLLLGDELQSRTLGLVGTSGPNARPHVSSFTGIYCRWIATLAGTSHSFEDASRIISGFANRLLSYEALDRAEILASLAFLYRKTGASVRGIETLLFAQLNALPPPVMRQLFRLGILDRASDRKCELVGDAAPTASA